MSIGTIIISIIFNFISENKNGGIILGYMQVILGYITFIITGLALYLAYHFTVQQSKFNADLMEANELYNTADNMEKIILKKGLSKENVEELTKIASNLRSRAKIAKQGFIHGYRNIDKL